MSQEAPLSEPSCSVPSRVPVCYFQHLSWHKRPKPQATPWRNRREFILCGGQTSALAIKHLRTSFPVIPNWRMATSPLPCRPRPYDSRKASQLQMLGAKPFQMLMHVHTTRFSELALNGCFVPFPGISNLVGLRAIRVCVCVCVCVHVVYVGVCVFKCILVPTPRCECPPNHGVHTQAFQYT